MFKKSLTILAVVAVVFAAFVAMQPSQFSVTRSIKINAAPAVIFAHINNQQKWHDWSPWTKLDPKMVQVFEGPDEGVGSIARWSGDRMVGKGSSEIVESKPDEYVKFQLKFEEPMKSEHVSEFSLVKEGNDTLVTWTMTGEKNFAAKAMGLFCNCDEKVGGMFEEGLANLKMVAQKAGEGKAAKK